ncbi:MAG: tRNA pseudouridine(38-40) synthase TruA [Desulfobacterales bacterium]
MVRNFKLTIEYDGGAYHGWQRQSDKASIQDEIERALAAMTGRNVVLNGSGRTDAGVHALGQTANFRCDTELTPDIFAKGLNSLLPNDIVVTSCCYADNDFHARYDVKSKRYCYCILNRPIRSAIGRGHAWHIRKKLDIDGMQKAARHLVGTHDFKSFQAQGSGIENTNRHIMDLQILRKNDRITIEIQADGFLRFMVRTIVGTLVNVGQGKLSPDDVKDILTSKDRSRAGATAPPHGLFLISVNY